MKRCYKKLVKSLLLLIICVFISTECYSETYYLAPTGNDKSGDGSINNPWLTLSNACANTTNVGDIIHVIAGTYNETAQSVLSVGVSIEGASKTTTIINYTYNSGNEYIGCISLVSKTDRTNGNQTISQLTINGSSLTAKTAIVVWGRSNVKIHDIAINDFNNMGILVNGNANGSSGFVPTSWATGNEIYNCNIFNSSVYIGNSTGTGRGAIWFGAQEGMKVYNCNIDQTTRPVGNNGYCIKVWGGGNKGSKIYNNYLNKSLSDGITWDFAFEGDPYDQGGLEIYNNTIIGAIDIGAKIKGDYTYSAYIHNNRIGKLTRPTTIKEEGIVVEDQTTDLIIRYNYFYNLTAGITFNSGGATSMNNIYIQYNIFDQLSMSGTNYQAFGIYGATINTASACNNWFIDNNVFVGYTATTGDVGIMLPAQGGADCTNINIRNNIFKNLDYAAINVNGTLGGTINGLTIQNNITWNSGNSNDPLWQGGFVPSNLTNTNNQKADPSLVSASDFNLQTGSPCINKGINIGLSNDYVGKSIVELPDLGAFEFGSKTDSEKPIVTVFTIPSTATTLSVSITTFTATDNIGVTGYLLTETSATPTVGASGWSLVKPATYTFSSTGSKTLYAWAKDAAGNVSASLNASVTISSPLASTYTVTGPSSGNVNSASSNFTVTPNNTYTGTITITPTGAGSAGLSAKVLTFSNSSTAQTFSITPTVAGSITLTPSNNGTLTNPANISYTVNAVVPNVPTSVVATAGNASVSVNFVAPVSNGGSAITGYTVTSIPAGGTDANAGSTLLTHTITGLTNGTSYTFTVKATNSIGTSLASVASNSVTPRAPVATGFTFSGPSSGNVNSISNYFTVTPNNPFTGTITLTPSGTGSAGLSTVVLIFSNSATAQTFTIIPTVAGSITLTPTNNGTLINPANLSYNVNAVVPNAPTSVVASSGDASASVTFMAPTNTGGSVITGYTVTSIPSGGIDANAGSTALTHTITGLTNGTSYAFTVKATNSVGSSVASVASNSVIPVVASVIIKQGEIIPSHFITVWQGLNGLNQMNINVVSASIEDLPLSINDEIAVFSGSACVGASKLTKSIIPSDNTTFVTILASQNDGSGNGFADNDTIVFKIWNNATQKELQINSVVYHSDISTWKTNGRYSPASTAVAEISSYQVYTQSIELLKGYNMISTYVSAQNPNISVVTKTLVDQGNLIKMQDETGNSLENWGTFGGWINQLGSMEETEGYKIQVANNCTLQVTGRSIAMPFDIALKTGWNIISFPRTDVVNAINVVQPLIDQNKLVKVQDEAGNSIENWGLFGGWKNGIGNFIPGKAYKVKMSADAMLTFQESYPKSALVLAKSEQTEYYHSSVEGNGTDHMNINITGLNNIGLSAGDELAAFDGAVCVATTKITEANLLSASASLASSFSTNDQSPNGFKSGNPIQILAWNKLNGEESKVNTEVITGQLKYEKNASVLVKMKSAILATGITNLNDAVKIDVFPNPCQGQVIVRFSEIPEENSRIEISDISGRKLISRLVIGTSEAFNLDTFTPGLYLVKTILGTSEFVQKLIVSK